MNRQRRTARRPRRRRRSIATSVAWAIAAPVLAYAAAATVGSLVPVNRDWVEPDEGITIYLANNGIHASILLPARAGGVEIAPFFGAGEGSAQAREAGWVAFGSGERHVFLDTPRWRDVTLSTLWSAATGGERVMRVEWIDDPAYAQREIRLRPEEFRRLWAAIRDDFERRDQGRPIRIPDRANDPDEAYYSASGKANLIFTCNAWAAARLRTAGVETSLWPPLVQGLTWRYRRSAYST